MDNEENNIEIKNPILCIICLEELDNNIKKICVNCNIKCHEKCLRKWHKSKKKPVCPICLKTKKYYKKINFLDEDIEVTNSDNIYITDEDNYSTDEDNYIAVEEDNTEDGIINNYLNRENRGVNFSYYLLGDICITKKYITYFFIFILGIYVYETTS